MAYFEDPSQVNPQLAQFAQYGSNLGLGSGTAQYQAQQFNKAQKEKARTRLYNELMRSQEADYKRAEQQQRAMLRQIAESYAQAQSQMGRGADVARQDVADMSRYNQAQMQQQMMSRGLGNTTAYDAGQRAVNADAARRYAQISQGLGQQMAGLSQNRAAAMAGAQNAVTNFYQQQAAARNALVNQMERGAPQRRRRSGLLGALGGLAGAFLGGPGGAVVGNALFGGGGGGGSGGGGGEVGYGGMGPSVADKFESNWGSGY